MRLINTKDPDDVAKIYPWLIPTENMNRMDIATEIYGRLKQAPEDTFVLVAVERNITRAVLVAYVLSKRVVWCWQAGSQSGFKYGRYMFEALKSWAKSRGARKIGAGVDDERHREYFKRQWGFKPLRNGELRLKI